MVNYNKFIPENKAPINDNYIYIYNENSEPIGKIKIEKQLKAPNKHRLYSFGALSDIHLQSSTAKEDFVRALTYFNNEKKVDFICICGDLTNNGNRTELLEYKTYVQQHSSNIPVYECTGNHETWNGDLNQTSMLSYTDHQLYYSFEVGNDVFIMFGIAKNDYGYEEAKPFLDEAIQRLYETLEANRNKRCFVFEHAPRFDGSGMPYPNQHPTIDILNCQQGRVFISLMEHYKNVIWFHGHTHTNFGSQEDCTYANYDNIYGCKSIHIPSLAMTRDYNGSYYEERYAESEGYIVDVFENGLYLCGRNFVNEKFLPIATYWIETPLIDIPEKSYIDETKTIVV